MSYPHVIQRSAMRNVSRSSGERWSILVLIRDVSVLLAYEGPDIVHNISSGSVYVLWDLFLIKFPITKYSDNTPEGGVNDTNGCNSDHRSTYNNSKEMSSGVFQHLCSSYHRMCSEWKVFFLSKQCAWQPSVLWTRLQPITLLGWTYSTCWWNMVMPHTDSKHFIYHFSVSQLL